MSRPAKSKPAAPEAVVPPWQRPPKPMSADDLRAAEERWRRKLHDEIDGAQAWARLARKVADAIGGGAHRAFGEILDHLDEHLGAAREWAQSMEVADDDIPF